MQCRHKPKFFDGQKKSTGCRDIIPSTFIKSDSNSSILGLDNMLHSKSTYFYRWGNKTNPKRRFMNISFLARSFQRHSVALSSSKESDPRQPGNNVLWNNRARSLPAFCILALLVGIGIISIVGPNKAYADSVALTMDSGNPTNDSKTNAIVNEMVYRTYKFKVTYEGEAGYYIGVNTENGSDGKLVNADAPTFRIGGVGDGVKPGTDGANFAMNTWGYALTRYDTTPPDTDTLLYNTVPEFSDPMIVTKHDVGGDYFLSFAAKFGEDAPNGDYKTNVYLSATMEAGEVVDVLGFGGVSTMQDLTPELCKSIDITNGEVEGLLKDDRDDKIYWVAKLKDGNCWMTQNLDYDDPNSKKLAMQDNNGFSTDSNGTPIKAYTDPGMYTYVKNGNGRGTDCDTASADHGGDLSVCSGWLPLPGGLDLSFTETRDVNFVNANTYTGTDGTTICTKEQGSPIGGVGYSTAVCKVYYYDYKSYLNKMAGTDYRHYLAGNYYDWPSATGANSNQGVNGNQTSSGFINVDVSNGVCPKGWTMPITGGFSQDDIVKSNGSFWYLLEPYGMADYSSQMTNQFYGKPLYLVYGGYVNGGQYVANVNSAGYLWSGTLSGYRNNAFDLQFYNNVNVRDRIGGTYNTSYFMPVRCLVKSS